LSIYSTLSIFIFADYGLHCCGIFLGTFEELGSVGSASTVSRLLPLVNAPFDWFSLGLTRALLRRGLELGGWWPYVLGLADVILAAFTVVLLTLFTVFCVQAFNDFAANGGGSPVLNLGLLLLDISSYPSIPQHWWVYTLLLSTMIPSLINLMIGGASLARGVPGISSLLLRKLPVGKTVPPFERFWVAPVLALQTVGGAVLGLVVTLLTAWVVIFSVMPWFGFELLDMARDVAAFNLPLRAWQLVESIL
jgi:hypothetical protein